MFVRTKKTFIIVILVVLAVVLATADEMTYSGVNDLTTVFTIEAGLGIHTFTVTVDTDDTDIDLDLLDYDIDNSIAPAPFDINFGAENRAWDLTFNGDSGSSGVNIDLSQDLDPADNTKRIILKLIANPDTGFGDGTFDSTYTWTFIITDPSTATYDYKVSTGAANGSTIIFPEIHVMQDMLNLPDGSGVYNFVDVEPDGDGGATSGYVVFTIYNQDTGNLDLDTITLGGTDPGDFDLDQSTITTPVPGSTSTPFSIRFDPLSAGSKVATVTIPNNDIFESEYTFEVQGNGAVPPPDPDIDVLQDGASIPGGDYDFEDTVADGNGTITAGAVIFTVVNIGGGTLTVSDMTFSAGDTVDFDLVEGTGNAPVDFQIDFDPLSTGAKSATVSITSNDPDDSTYTFTVSGTGTPVPTPEINLKKDTADIPSGTNGHVFGNVLADGVGGDDDGPVTFTIENSGSADLNITSVTLTAGDVDDFIVDTGGMDSTVADGDTTTFTVVFDPRSPGPKGATITIANNDSDERTYTFAVTGNALPLDKVFFPPTYALPWELEPTIDGVVDDHPTDPAQNELGWNNAFRLTYDNGTEPQMAFQGLRHASGNPQYLLLSFEVKNDLSFEDEDLIILTFRQNQELDADQTKDLRIFVFPVYTGIGAKDPGAGNADDDPNDPKPNRPVQDVRYYTKVQQPDESWDWVEIFDVDTDDFEYKVYSYPEGSNYAWDVEMKIPTSITRSGSEWIKLQPNFKFFFDVVRVNSVDFGIEDDGYATQYTWPRNLPEAPYGDLESDYEFPYIFWGDSAMNNTGQVKGVWIEHSGVGVLNDPCQASNIEPNDISCYIKTGTFDPGTGELLSRAHNRLVAVVKNTTEKVAGNPPELQAVEAEKIRVRFRLAHWGATLGEEGDWIVIEGLDEGDLADPPFPAAPVCSDTFTFKTARDNDGWLVPDQTVPAATSPFAPGESNFFYDFILTGDENSGDVKHFKSVQDHQCIYVEVDSLGNADILTRSTWRNMDFVNASRYSDTARISTRGCGPPPEGRSTYRVILQTRERTWIYKPERERKDPKADSTRSAARRSMIADDWLTVSNPFPSPPAAVDSFLEYIVDAYYDSGDSVIINGKTFLLYRPIGSFGYVAHHDGPVEEWQAVLTSDGDTELKTIAGGIYTLEIPPDSHVNIQPVIRSVPPPRYAVSLHGGVSLPLSGFTGGHEYGVGGAVDFDVRLWPCLSVAAIGGFNWFVDRDGAVDPRYIITAAASLRFHRALGSRFSLFGGGGLELLFVQNGARRTDLLAEAGLDVKVSRLLTLEAGARFHGLIDSSVRFMTADLGALLRF